MLKSHEAVSKNKLSYGQSLIDEVRAIKSDIQRIQLEAESRRDIRAALLAIRERLAVAELEAKLTGHIGSKPTNELHLHFPPERALAVAEAYVARHGPATALPELQAAAGGLEPRRSNDPI
jgi:hypothetical protein